MFNRKLKAEVATLRGELDRLRATVHDHYDRVTSLRRRVGEEGLANLKRFAQVNEDVAALAKDVERLRPKAPETVIAVDYGAGPDMTTGIVAQRVGDSLRIVAEFRVVHDEIVLDLRGTVVSTIEVPEIMAAVSKACGR